MQVCIYALITFFVQAYAGIILCNVIQSMIRSIIAAVFLFRFLEWSEYPKAAKISFWIYLLVLLIFDLFIAIDVFLEHGVTCDSERVNW